MGRSLAAASIHVGARLQDEYVIANHCPFDVLVDSAQCLFGTVAYGCQPRDQGVGQHLAGAGQRHLADTAAGIGDQLGVEFPGFSGHLTEGGDALPRTRQD